MREFELHDIGQGRRWVQVKSNATLVHGCLVCPTARAIVHKSKPFKVACVDAWIQFTTLSLWQDIHVLHSSMQNCNMIRPKLMPCAHFVPEWACFTLLFSEDLNHREAVLFTLCVAVQYWPVLKTCSFLRCILCSAFLCITVTQSTCWLCVLVI